MLNLVKKFLRKTISVVTAMSIVVLNIPIASQNQTFAASPSIPANMFAFKSELSNFFDLTGSNESGETGYISFGERINTVYYGSSGSVGPGPITWQIAGHESENDIILFSKEPILSANKYFDSDRDQNLQYRGLFSGIGDNIYDHSKIDDQTGSSPSTIYTYLQGAVSNSDPDMVYDTEFTSAQQALMLDTTITSYAGQNNTNSYTTTDKLYLPTSNCNLGEVDEPYFWIYVGSNDQFAVSGWRGDIWLRSLTDTSGEIGYATASGDNFGSTSPTDDTISTSAALKIDISNVAFASAASSSTINDDFVEISPDEPVMELKLMNSSTFSNSTIKLANTGDPNNPQIVWENAPANSRLVVLASDGQNTYQRSKEVSGSGSEYVQGSQDSYPLPTPQNGDYSIKVWLETKNDGLTYVKNATEGQGIASIIQGKITPSNLSFTGLNSNFTYTYSDGLTFTVGITGTNLGTGAITYSSSDSNVAQVNSSSGKVTVNKAGKFRITANIAEDDTHNPTSVQSNTITINKADQEPLSISGLNSSYDYGATGIKVSVSGGNGSGAISYKSSDNSVATIDNSGNITINKAGTFTITVTKAGGDNYNDISTTSDIITVNKIDQAPLSLSGLNSSYRVGETGVRVIVSGGSGNGAISYSSSNDSVAQIDSVGIITFLSDGTFTITATKSGGDYYNDASVTSNVISVSHKNQGVLTLSGLQSSYNFGDSGIKVNVSGGSGDGALSYESSNNDVASIDNSGNITIKKVGTFTITVTKAGDTTYNPQSVTSELITVNPISAENVQMTVEQSTHIYDSEPFKPNFEMKFHDITLVENQDYTITLPEDMTSVGEKNVTINFIGNYTGSKSITLEIVVDKSQWGNKVENDGIVNYIAKDGTVSAEVTGNEKIWIKAQAGQLKTYYFFDNSQGILKKGSRLYVRLFNKNTDSDDYQKYYNKLDDAKTGNIYSNKILIFLTGAVDPDGNEYTSLNGELPLYLQLGNNINYENIKAVFISDGSDEILDVSLSENISLPSGTDTFAKLTLNHFSPYAIYNYLKVDDNPSQGGDEENQGQGEQGGNEENQGQDKDESFEYEYYDEYFDEEFEDEYDYWYSDALQTGDSSNTIRFVFITLIAISSTSILLLSYKRKTV